MAKNCPHCGFPLSNQAGGQTNPELATVPILSVGQKTIHYGIYPQDHVSDPNLVNALNGLGDTKRDSRNGWYLYNGQYYTKTDANPAGLVEFNNDDHIYEGRTYWFRCDPIVWDVLSKEGGKSFVLAHNVLDSRRFDAKTSNYARSEIRSWLNGDFLKSAFALGNSHILTLGSGRTNDKNYGGDLRDKVFLPTWEDLANPTHGFNAEHSCGARKRKATDWALARGVDYFRDYTYPGVYGKYMTRSPGPWGPYVYFIYLCGDYDVKEVKQEALGVCPALVITLN